MRAVALTGNAMRHAYVASCMGQGVDLAGVVLEQREAFVPRPPDGLEPHLEELFVRHFRGREDAEERFFGGYSHEKLSCPQLEIDRDELNSERVRQFVTELQPDVVVTYGVHKLDDETLDRFPQYSWNVHGGLSPWYRGVITHFWPSYMLEPQMTGVTLHRLSNRLDAGHVVHQTLAPLVAGDGIHELACRTVQRFGEELREVLGILAAGRLQDPRRQRSSGKLWLAKDWRPDHLRLIYDLYYNRIVDAYLGGQLQQFDPKTVRQF